MLYGMNQAENNMRNKTPTLTSVTGLEHHQGLPPRAHTAPRVHLSGAECASHDPMMGG
jgi:hypothetical protein